MKTILFEPRAARQLDKLSDVARRQVLEGLMNYAITGIGDVKNLQNRPGYRLRIGSYRVIFSEDRTTILTLEILRRDSTTYR